MKNKKENEFRFDDAYENVYQKIYNSYIFIGSYYSFGLDKNMSDNEKIKRVELTRMNLYLGVK